MCLKTDEWNTELRTYESLLVGTWAWTMSGHDFGRYQWTTPDGTP